jgi:hypothetical protein
VIGGKALDWKKIIQIENTKYKRAMTFLISVFLATKSIEIVPK